MMSTSDPEEYLVIMRAKACADEETPSFYKSVKEAEILCGFGRHAEALPHFETALVLITSCISRVLW